jgi:hypothetical protein
MINFGTNKPSETNENQVEAPSTDLKNPITTVSQPILENNPMSAPCSPQVKIIEKKL